MEELEKEAVRSKDWKTRNRTKSCPEGTKASGLASSEILHCIVQYFLENSFRETITFKSQEYIFSNYPQNDYYQKYTQRQLITEISILRKFVSKLSHCFGGDRQGLCVWVEASPQPLASIYPKSLGCLG